VCCILIINVVPYLFVLFNHTDIEVRYLLKTLFSYAKFLHM